MFLTGLFLFVALAFADRQLLQVALLHRHGARTEPFVSDHGLNWDSCVLSEAGVEMALSLGRFTRSQYNSFLPLSYDSQVIVSRSTEFERTIRTGVGVLRGMYNGSNDIPFLTHVPPDVDFLLGFYYSWPSAVLGTPYIEGYNQANNNVTLAYFPQTNLSVIGEQLNCPHLCDNNQTLCALLGEDVSTCRLSNGGLSSNLSQFFPEMFRAQELSNAFLYLYNETDEYWRHTGPYGRPLALRISTDFNSTITSFALNGTLPQTRFFQYSAHDVTIYAFFVTIGAITASETSERILVPSFASAVFMELYSDGNITVAFYEANQSFGSGFGYSKVPGVRMGCKVTEPRYLGDESDAYFATECPLSHFVNFVNTKAPTFPNSELAAEEGADPWCYADPQDIITTNCHPSSTDVPTHAACIQYRMICPQFSCDATLGLVLDRTNFACVHLIDTSGSWASKMRRDVGWYFGLVIASILIGFVVGLVIRAAFFERESKHADNLKKPLNRETDSLISLGTQAAA